MSCLLHFVSDLTNIFFTIIKAVWGLDPGLAGCFAIELSVRAIVVCGFCRFVFGLSITLIAAIGLALLTVELS